MECGQTYLTQCLGHKESPVPPLIISAAVFIVVCILVTIRCMFTRLHAVGYSLHLIFLN